MKRDNVRRITVGGSTGRRNGRKALLECLESRVLLSAGTVLPVTAAEGVATLHATLAQHRTAARILDNEPTPTVTMPDKSVNVGRRGHMMKIPVMLSNPSSKAVKIKYTTTSVTALRGKNYQLSKGTLTIPAGSTTGYILARVLRDAAGEQDNVLDVNFLSAKNATLAGTGYSRVVIRDHTAAGIARPTITLSDATAVEGEVESFNVTLLTATTQAVTVRYYTEPGTATTANYTPVDGILTIPAGSTTGVITVQTGSIGNLASANFKLALSAPANADLTNTTANGTIWNLPDISLGSASLAAITDDPATSIMTFTATLSKAVSFPVTVDYATADGTAIAGTDYTAANGTLTFAPGQTSQTIDVTVRGNSVAPTETLDVNLSNAANAAITHGTGVGTIAYQGTDLSDNLAVAQYGEDVISTTAWPAASFRTGSSSVSLSSISIPLQMDQSGSATLMIYSDNSGQPGALVGTLTSPSSYSSSTHALTTFTASGISLSANTTYWVVMKAASGSFGVTIAQSSTGAGAGYTGAWLDNSGSGWSVINSGQYPPNMQVIVEGPANVSIAPASVTETVGNITTQTMTYTVTLSNASPFPVSVDYATADGTAAAGTDYTATSGTLIFAPGQTSKTISATVTGDASGADETFDMDLSNATNGTISSGTGVGTILAITDLSDNLAASSGGWTNAVGNQWFSQNFVTGSSSITLSSVSLLLRGSGTATAMIYSDSGGHPGSLVGTLTSPGSYSPSLSKTTFTASGITLSANTTYWVVLKAISGSFGWSVTNSTVGTGTGFTGTDAYVSTNAGSSWMSDGDLAQMQVLG